MRIAGSARSSVALSALVALACASGACGGGDSAGGSSSTDTTTAGGGASSSPPTSSDRSTSSARGSATTTAASSTSDLASYGSSASSSASSGTPTTASSSSTSSSSTRSSSSSTSSSTPTGDAGTSCGYDPVTPNATPQTRKVLCYLHSIYGNHILSGQEEDNNDNGMNTIYAATGKYPAIRAFDVNNSNAPTQCVAHWNNGGLCMFGYHMGINGGSFSATNVNIGNVLASGTSENTSFNADLDRIAQYVTPLKNAGGVAILRLFHEAGNGCHWFWWADGTSAQWQELLKYAFNYLTATKGLNNVLWIAPLCGSPTSAYNPGAQYIDFGGADDYVTAGDYEPLTSLFQATESAFPNMMVALHECGSIPDPVQLKSSATKWLFFNVWASPYFSAPNNPTAHLQAVYSNSYVLTRADLPSFK